MRPELRALKEGNWHVYGLGEDDFDYTLRLVNDMITARGLVAGQEAEELGTAHPEGADEIEADLLYYAWVDSQFLHQFCLWRLQGIFEGILVQDFLKGTRFHGLKAKLDAMRAEGYSIDQTDYDELLEWAQLRNALSHFPPEQYRPIEITENDIAEYVVLLKKTLGACRRGSVDPEDAHTFGPPG